MDLFNNYNWAEGLGKINFEFKLKTHLTMKKFLLALTMVAGMMAINAQTTIWSDDFDDLDVSDWMLYDEDGDGQLWYPALLTGGDTPILTSVSWSGFPLTPDNWAVSPAIDLSGATGAELKWFVFASDPLYNLENYGVYVATENTVEAFMTAGELFTEFDLPSELTERTLDVSAFDGQTIYVAFRHYNVSDQFRIGLDNISVTADGGGEPVEYCDIITLDCAVEKIDGVTFAGIENLNTGCGTAETNDFTNMVANVELGGTYDMILDIEADPSFPDDNAFFFIDWNQNGTLDDAGEVYEVVMHTGTSGQYTVSVTVPEDAELGETRLRVGIAYNSGPAFEPIACPTVDNVTYGEYEDYTVNVSEGGEPVEYCEIITLDCAVEKIDGVTFAGIENLNTGCGTAETNDFTNMVANVELGGTYDMILDIEADPSFPDDNAFFFIDWNQNGTLDDAGEVYEVVMHTGTSGQYTVSVTVPQDAEVGETRLRVGIAYNSGPDFEPIACPTVNNVTYGEYEDYTVNVSQLGVGDVNNASFALYPNPVKDAFTVKLSSEFDAAKVAVTVTDLSGKTVKTFGASDSYNVTDLSKGVYVVTITDGKNTETKKIVKK